MSIFKIFSLFIFLFMPLTSWGIATDDTSADSPKSFTSNGRTYPLSLLVPLQNSFNDYVRLSNGNDTEAKARNLSEIRRALLQLQQLGLPIKNMINPQSLNDQDLRQGINNMVTLDPDKKEDTAGPKSFRGMIKVCAALVVVVGCALSGQPEVMQAGNEIIKSISSQERRWIRGMEIIDVLQSTSQ